LLGFLRYEEYEEDTKNSRTEINVADGMDRRGDRRSPEELVHRFAAQWVAARTGDGPSPLRLVPRRTTNGLRGGR